jgi:hypothetical protein
MQIWKELKFVIWRTSLRLQTSTATLCGLHRGGPAWKIYHLLGIVPLDIEDLGAPPLDALPAEKLDCLPHCRLFHHSPGQHEAKPQPLMKGMPLHGLHFRTPDGEENASMAVGERLTCSMTRAAYDAYVAFWIMPEIFPRPKKLEAQFFFSTLELYGSWLAAVQLREHEEQRTLREVQSRPTVTAEDIWIPLRTVPETWPGSAPMPHWTSWHGIGAVTVLKPVPLMSWDGPHPILENGCPYRRKSVDLRDFHDATRKVFLQDLRHHSPYGFHWPNTAQTCKVESRLPWGTYPSSQPLGCLWLRDRREQRARGLYGGGAPEELVCTPENWCPVGAHELTEQSVDADSIEHRRCEMYAEADENFVLRDVLHANSMTQFQMFGPDVDLVPCQLPNGMLSPCLLYG